MDPIQSGISLYSESSLDSQKRKREKEESDEKRIDSDSSEKPPVEKRAKKEPSEDIVESFFSQNGTLSHDSSIEKKRKREKPTLEVFEHIFEKLKTFNTKSKEDSLDQIESYGKLFKQAKKLKKAAFSGKGYHIRKAEKQIKKEWTFGKNSEAWEKRIFEREDLLSDDKEWTFGEDIEAWGKRILERGNFHSVDYEDRISKQFRLVMKNPDLQKRYRSELEVIYELFKRRSQDMTIRPKVLKRITKSASLFGDEISFLIQEVKIFVPRTCLLSCKSPHFDLLLKETTGLFSESSGHPIQLRNIDIENFNLLKKWLIAPSDRIFENIEFMKILEFVQATHQFEISDLISHCDDALRFKIITQCYVKEELKFLKKVVDLLNQFTEFQKRVAHLNIQFPLLKDCFVEALKSFGLFISSWSEDQLFLKINKPIFQKIQIDRAVNQYDDRISISETQGQDQSTTPKTREKSKKTQNDFFLPDIRLFKEIKFMDLDLKDFKLTKEKVKELNSKFPKTKKILISFNLAPTNWTFLTEFENLREILITPKIVNTKWFKLFKKTFPSKKEWQISFSIKKFRAEVCRASKENPHLSIDDFVELKTLESLPTPFHSWPQEFQQLIRDEHLIKLIAAEKIDFESEHLDLRFMSRITLDPLSQIVNRMSQLKEGNFILNQNSQLLNLLLTEAPRLTKVWLHHSFFHQNNTEKVRIFINNYPQPEITKDLIIIIDSEINPNHIRGFLHFPNLRVKFLHPLTKTTLSLHSPSLFKIKLGFNQSHYYENDILCLNQLYLRPFSEVLRHFDHAQLILDAKSFNLYGKEMLTISEMFPETYKLKANWFKVDELNSFPKLKILTVPSSLQPESLNERFKDLENVDVVIEELKKETCLEEFIVKVNSLMDLMPPLQPLFCLNKTLRADLTDDDLRRFKPRLCHSYLDFSGMSKISYKIVLEFLKTFKVPIDIQGCMRIIEEINNGVISLDEFMTIYLADKRAPRILSHQTYISVLRKKMTDQHIQLLLDAGKVPQHSHLDLSFMPLIGSSMFERLIKEIEPKSLVLHDVAPSLFSKVPMIASKLFHVTLPSTAFKEENFLDRFLENFIKDNQQKSLIISFKLEDDPYLIKEILEKFSDKGNGRVIIDFTLNFPVGLHLKDVIEKLKAWSSSLNIFLTLPDPLKSEFSDQDLYSLKPREGTLISGNFAGYSQITGDGLLRYLEGLYFHQLILTGCLNLSEEDFEKIAALYPNIQIVR